ncbi:WD40 repeat-like protein [Fomitiporia mediterranea MF3/22]|uniref:WD40 repeat-like protein n=1 Tax=Fomitiporia mediterranea (strain MF3/22) TaxID=694068 RepID=UPI0004408BCF|nr:WD40 repeat-like protein [Fomitiporia mediterranea MF3/22]EJC99333.1 WD40 repeat-like protein [Fomitiporia mediterranea MF3/22]
MAPPLFTLTSLFPANPNTDRGASTKLHISKDNKLIYANGRTVIIRDLKNPSAAKAYSGHSRNVTVARFSPSGYYCASADTAGTVRVWDTLGEENILKREVPAISGKVNDLAWDGDSQRIIAVGDGRETFGKAFMVETGSSTGEIAGHTKVINAVSIRHQRPFRAVTASDDCTIVFHTGVPFKYEKTIKTHTKFVQDVRYSANGDHFASVGSDSKVFLYEGKTGEPLGECSGEVHKGSIMAASWSPDSKNLATSSLDGTVKLWDVERKLTVQTWTVGTGVQNQQVGNAWGPEGDIVSLSMSGIVNVFDQRKGDGPAHLLIGPQKTITAATLTASGTFIAGTADGRLLSYDIANGDAQVVSGTGHLSLVTSIVSAGENTYSVGIDNALKEISPDAKSMTEASTNLQSQAKALALSDEGTTFVSEADKIEGFRSNQRVAQLPVKYQANGIASTGKLVAVGGGDNKIHLYSWNGKELKEDGVLETPRGPALTLAFSPDGKLLVSGDATGKIILFDVTEKKAIESRWTNHASRVNSLVWAPTGTHIASGSLDTHVFVWSVANPLTNVPIRHAGPGGVNAVAWLEASKDKGKLATAGADGCVRIWEVILQA